MGKQKKQLQWTTEQRIVNDLLPYEFNPRVMTQAEAAQLEVSLTKFNLVEIPAINLDGTILAGHQRVKIMAHLGRGQEVIDVRVPNRLLEDDEVREYNLRSNKNTGHFDNELLTKNFEIAELLEFGFSEFEFGIVDPNASKTPKEKRFSIAYELVFVTEDERTEFKKFMKNLEAKYADIKTEGERLIKYIRENS